MTTPGASVPSEDARAAVKGGASLLVLQMLGRLAGLVFVLLVTRHLAPGDFGRYSTVAAIVLFGNFISDFGTSAAITRLVSRDPSSADDLLAGTLLGSLALGLVAYAAAVGFGALSYGRSTVLDTVIGAAGLPAASMLSSVLAALDGNGLIGRRATISALQTFTIAAGAVPVLLGTGVRGAFATLALAPVATLVVAGVAARRYGLWSSRLRVDISQTYDLMRSALPYALTGGLAALTMRFDVVLLSLVTSSAETARYDLALRLLEAGTYVSTAFTAPLLFLVSRRLGAGDRDGAGRAFTEALQPLFLLGLPMSAGLMLLARPIVSLALGPSYRGTAVPLAIMGAAQWLTWLISAQSAVIMAGDHMAKAVPVGARIAGVTVFLDLLLVPTLGATGAAVAMIVSWTFTVVTLCRLASRTLGIKTSAPSVAVLASTAVMVGVVVPLRNLPLGVPVGVGVVVYAAMVVATRAVTRRDIARVLALLRRRSGPAATTGRQAEALSRTS